MLIRWPVEVGLPRREPLHSPECSMTCKYPERRDNGSMDVGPVVWVRRRARAPGFERAIVFAAERASSFKGPFEASARTSRLGNLAKTWES